MEGGNATVKKRRKNGTERHRSGRDISSGSEVAKCQERNAVNQEKQLESGWTCKWAAGKEAAAVVAARLWTSREWTDGWRRVTRRGKESLKVGEGELAGERRVRRWEKESLRIGEESAGGREVRNTKEEHKSRRERGRRRVSRRQEARKVSETVGWSHGVCGVLTRGVCVG